MDIKKILVVIGIIAAIALMMGGGYYLFNHAGPNGGQLQVPIDLDDLSVLLPTETNNIANVQGNNIEMTVEPMVTEEFHMPTPNIQDWLDRNYGDEENDSSVLAETQTPSITATTKPTPTVSIVPTSTSTYTPAPSTDIILEDTIKWKGAYLKINTIEGVYDLIPLDHDGEIVIKQDNGAENIIQIHENAFEVIQSSCGDQYCISQGLISLDNIDSNIWGNTIICSPNNVMLQLLDYEKMLKEVEKGELSIISVE